MAQNNIKDLLSAIDGADDNNCIMIAATLLNVVAERIIAKQDIQKNTPNTDNLKLFDELEMCFKLVSIGDASGLNRGVDIIKKLRNQNEQNN